MLTSSSEGMHPPFTDPFRSGFPISCHIDLIPTLKPVRTDVFDTDKHPHRVHRCTLNLTALWHIRPIHGAMGTRRCGCMDIWTPPHPLLDAASADSTPIQTSGAYRNPRRSTIPAQILSQSIHELASESGSACAPPFGSSCGVPEARVSVAN
jgi:hypothetical protein